MRAWEIIMARMCNEVASFEYLYLPISQTVHLQTCIDLSERIAGITLQEGLKDKVHWAWEPSGNYSVRSAYAIKFAGRQHDVATTMIWNSRGLSDVSFSLG